MSRRKLERDRVAVHSTLHQDYAVENLFDDEREIQLFFARFPRIHCCWISRGLLEI